MSDENLAPEDSQIDDDDSVMEEADLLMEVVRSIVRNPDKVRIDSARGQKATLLTITVDSSDRGHVIGKASKTLDALIHLFAKAAFLDGERQIVLQLEGHTPHTKYPPRDDQQQRRNYGPRPYNGPNRPQGPYSSNNGPRNDNPPPTKEFRRPTGS